MTCPSDSQYTSTVQAFRAARPPPLLVTAAAWSVGAYGAAGPWADSPPQAPRTGMMINVLAAAGDLLDWLFLMAYDAGDVNTTGYDPRVRIGGWRVGTVGE